MTPSILGHVAMLLFSALVAGSFSLGVQIANDIDPAALNAIRFWIAAGVIGGFVVLSKGTIGQARRAPWRFVVLGGLFGAYFVLMFEGLKSAPPVSAAAVFTLTPVLAAGFAWLLLRQYLTPRMALALTIGAIGALWVIFRADLSALWAFDIGRGESIYFFGVLCHAIYTPLVRKLNRGEPALIFTFFTLIGGGLVLTIFGWNAIVSTAWTMLPPKVWLVLLYLALFASAGSVWLLQTATLRLPAAKVMAYTYLVPSWVVCWEMAQRRGAMDPAVFGGVILTVLALALLLRDETPVSVGTT